LILIDDSIFSVDKVNSDNFILNIFYRKGYYVRWILYYLSIYDEKQDGIKLKQAFEVNTFFVTCFIIDNLIIFFFFIEHSVFVHILYPFHQIIIFNPHMLEMW
jgi:hypothetical protein